MFFSNCCHLLTLCYSLILTWVLDIHWVKAEKGNFPACLKWLFQDLILKVNIMDYEDKFAFKLEDLKANLSFLVVFHDRILTFHFYVNFLAASALQKAILVTWSCPTQQHPRIHHIHQSKRKFCHLSD